MKKDKDLFREELVQSPGRTAALNFLKKKLSIVGIAVFLSIFALCFGLSFIMPIDLNYSDSERQNLPPSYNYLSLPKALTDNAKAVDFGSTFGAGIDRDGKFYMWGTMSDTVAKVKTDLPADMKPLKLVACGLDHIVAVAEDNTIYTWGNNRLNITTVNPGAVGKNIVAIQAGYQSTLVLDDTGRLYFWGNASMFSYKPDPADQGHFTAFTLNIATAIALKDDKTVVCLSATDSHFHRIPDRVQGRAVGLASTDKTAAALLDDGTVVTWGSFAAPAYTVPDEIQGRVVDIDGGKTHYTVLLDDGSVYSWGEDMFSQASYPRVSNIARINTAYYQNAAIDPGGKVTVWGQKGYLMGTDAIGRDVLTRLVYGGRVTLTVGFISVLISAVIGIVIGGLSGYFGGKVDMFLMRFAEVVSSIPQLPLMMILSAVLVSAISETMRVIMIMFIL
ncbi:MAG: peptide ABC transporter permease, partial [Oscillospiraceae bacterium]|nr:peptide ABC transporter permease [Oscillospiraceae bacterium]